MDKDKVAEFLADLATISRKHKIIIGGCGCCGSPYLADLEDEEAPGQYEVGNGIFGGDTNLEWVARNA